MGRDKAAIAVSGVSLLRRTAEVALKLSSRVYVVTTPDKDHDALLPDNVEIILERDPQGPLQAFAQALAQVQSDWVLLLACDLPHLSANPLRTWMAHLDQIHAMAYLPRHPKGWEPLCGFYHTDCLASLNAFQGRSFQQWLATQPVAEIAIDNPQILFNCNTIADLEAIAIAPAIASP